MRTGMRQVAKGEMVIPSFIQHVKKSFTFHFEGDDMTFVCWAQEQRTKLSETVASH